ncbi:MAG: SGNH/GDSL hydrolase family protein [Acetatifactor sp.]|nr:SGNH/GDSL hydrolase family protein [Acetatifactor sp.]
MKKVKEDQQSTEQSRPHKIPDIDIIDLESANDRNPDDTVDASRDEEESIEQEPAKQGFAFNMHTAMHLTLLIVVVVVICGIAIRIINWGNFISQEDIFKDGEGTYEDTLDQFFPVLDETGHIISNDDDELNILVIGNSPFSDDRDSKDGLANMIAERTGANVINCSVSGSYMAAQNPYLNAEIAPMDVYTPYWLCSLAFSDVHAPQFLTSAEVLGENTPPDAAYVYETLSNLDMNTVDVVVFMYDATDYLMGHEMYNDLNSTDLQQFTGSMEASIELIQLLAPQIRIIVMSPTYAFGIDENGEYISSDIKTYGQHFLSTYVIKQAESCFNRSVTFVDNLYGTINEDNASEYLTDNIHLNVEGRKLVADRFIKALTYFDG